jgi:hypothetical protein
MLPRSSGWMPVILDDGFVQPPAAAKISKSFNDPALM